MCWKKTIFMISILVFLGCGCAQEKEKKYNVGIAQFVSAPVIDEIVSGLYNAFDEAGYGDGSNVTIERATAQGDFSTIYSIIQKFKSSGKNMIITVSTPTLQAAINSRFSGPVIFCGCANPVLAGAGSSDSNHLSNVTGVKTTSPFRQTIEIIKEAFPKAKTIGTLYSPAEVNSEYYMERAKEEAEKAGLSYIAVPVSATNEIVDAAKILLLKKKVDVFYQINDNLSISGFPSLVALANKNKIALVANSTKLAKTGACIGVGWDFFDVGKRGGQIAIQVINGDNPETIPFQSMEKSFIAINRQAAEMQGVKIPDSVIKKADSVF